jgi:hypothetical protein
VHMKLVTLIKICLTKTHSNMCTDMGECLSDMFPIQNRLNQGDSLLPLLLTVLY